MIQAIALFIALLQVTHSFGLLPARASRWRLCCLLEDTVAKAKRIVGKNNTDLVLTLSLELLASEKENEKKFELLAKENEKKLTEAYFDSFCEDFINPLEGEELQGIRQNGLAWLRRIH